MPRDMEEKIKVLVVDDAAFMRRAVTRILNSDPGIEVVDSAQNGQEGLEKIKKLRPDVVTLDIDMPVMDGLTAIRHIMIESPVPVVVLSSLFKDGAITFDALRLGVVDFVPKPSGAISTDIDKTKQQIIDRVKMACAVNQRNIRRVHLPRWDIKKDLADRYRYYPLDYLLAMGTSLSGPNTVIRLLSKLPPTLPAAVVVVQEISPRIIRAFVEKFDEHVPWKVEVAREDTPLEQGTCYIGTNEYSLRLGLNAAGAVCLKSGTPVEQPLNLLFSSAADIFQRQTIGVLLTGTGDDGAEGLTRIRKHSGITMAQATRCCVYPNLTDNAIEKGTIDFVLDEKRLPGAIESAMKPQPGIADEKPTGFGATIN